jgi:RNA polymerase sigma factor (sigma-70 family)
VTSAGVTRADEFEQLRPLLFAIAYRILSSVSEAEDAVQETWLRFEATATQPTSTRAFLSAVVTRISIDVLRSARVRREQYVGNWFPEPLLSDPYEDPERSAELADSVSMAALLLLERLSPLERAVFVLHEVNGQAGAILRDRDGKVLNTLALDILDGQIQTIRSVINPQKLGHVGPVADAWAVIGEALEARRQPD